MAINVSVPAIDLEMQSYLEKISDRDDRGPRGSDMDAEIHIVGATRGLNCVIPAIVHLTGKQLQAGLTAQGSHP